MVWYCDKCKSYHADGQWCPNMGVLDPVIDFFGGVMQGYNEGSKKVENEHREWQRQFDEDNRRFQERLFQASMEDAATKRRREEAEYSAQVMREQAEQQQRILRLQLELEKERQRKKSQPYFDPYEILGVSDNATRSEVYEAFKRESQRWHPDKFSKYDDSSVEELAKERFRKIIEAYDEIMRMKGWN